MFRRYCYALLVLITCTGLFACDPKNIKQPDLHLPTTTFAWETPLPGASGKIEITYQLPQHARAEFRLFKQKVGHQSTALATAKLTNENCLRGHQLSLTYATHNSEFYTQYFTKELDWNNHNTITIQWVGNNILQIIANNETLSIPTTEQSQTLQIISHFDPIEIQQVKYVSQ